MIKKINKQKELTDKIIKEYKEIFEALNYSINLYNSIITTPDINLKILKLNPYTIESKIINSKKYPKKLVKKTLEPLIKKFYEN